MVVYLALLVGLGYAYIQLPTSFLPNEDQGFLIVDMQAPSEASGSRTQDVIEQVEQIFGKEEAVERVVAVSGFSFAGSGQNAGLAFVSLKDWSERGPENSADAIAGRANGQIFGTVKDAMAFSLSPPPIQGLGNSSGFTFRLQDRGGMGQAALSAARDQLMAAAQQSKVVTGLRVEGMPDAAQVNLVIDREKANAFGVTFADINSTISANLGSSYVNDFPNAGRMQRVTVQADAEKRMQTADLLKLNVRNASGGMVPLSSFASVEWIRGPAQIVGYNGYPSVRISGQAAPWLLLGRCHRRDGTAGSGPAERLRLRVDRPVAAGDPVGLAGAGADRPVDPVRLPAPGGAVRELVDPAVGHARRAARRHRLGAGGHAARHVQRRLLHGRPDRHHRPVGEERDPDHRVRQGPAGRGQVADGSGDRGSAAALPPDPDDLAGLHARRRAAGDRHGRRAPRARTRSAPASWAA